MRKLSLDLWREFFHQNRVPLERLHSGLSWDVFQSYLFDPWCRSFTVSSPEKIQKDLLSGRPIQHIFGMSYFYGQRFLVGPECLIPRPETEGLIAILEDHIKTIRPRGNSLIGAEIGVGSGALSICLAQHPKIKSVYGTDIDKAALDIAKSNIRLKKAKVFLKLGDRFEGLPFDLDFVVSNPPYIPKSSLPQVSPQVLEHEPYSALFLEDAEYFDWYRVFFSQARVHLKKNTPLIMEGESDKLVELLEVARVSEVKGGIQNDLSGRPRYLVLNI